MFLLWKIGVVRSSLIYTKKNWKLKGHNSDGHVDTSNINFIENEIGGAYH